MSSDTSKASQSLSSMSKTYLDLANWHRRQHFDFFKEFAEPFHGMTVQIPCGPAKNYCREQGYSFFLFYLHQCLLAVNQTEALRLRIESDATGSASAVAHYQQIHVNCTIARADHSFGFCPLEFHSDWLTFAQAAQAPMAMVKASQGLNLQAEARDDLIHFSAIPWLNFSALTHARARLQNGLCTDSVPKISIGKLTEVQGQLVLPVALFAHHGLADAYHFAQFYARLEAGLLLQART